MEKALIQQIIQWLSLPDISKVDPNLQEIPNSGELTVLDKLTQASIPAVLLGITNIATIENKADDDSIIGRVLHMQRIFPQNYAEIVQSVAEYSGASIQDVYVFMDQVGMAAESIIKEHVGEHADAIQMRDYVVNEKHKIFFYLPPQLHLGTLTGDPSQDDGTKKMEGPFSNIAHKIEDGLSNTE